MRRIEKEYRSLREKLVVTETENRELKKTIKYRVPSIETHSLALRELAELRTRARTGDDKYSKLELSYTRAIERIRVADDAAPPPMVALAMSSPGLMSTMPWIGAHNLRPYTASSVMLLFGAESQVFSGVKAHALDRRLGEILMAPTSSRQAIVRIDDVPGALVFCYACHGHGEHSQCCNSWGCAASTCSVCDGLGWVIPRKRWAVQLSPGGAYLDAAYLRLALAHLGTESVTIGTSGEFDPFVFEANGKHAVVMPLRNADHLVVVEVGK